jgi:gamma-glutamyltranspeptidase/glutathione hydrolase
VGATCQVATSHPLAARAGVRALERGGNACDAAIAAAAVLCVAEPMSTGVGGDMFALVWKDGELSGLDAAGPAPLAADPTAPVEQLGARSVTVPGAVGGWAALADRHGRLGLDTLLADAVDAARTGVAVGPVTAASWRDDGGLPELGSPPAVGELVRIPELGETLARIAADGPAAFYSGNVGDAIVASTWLEESDLAGYSPAWVEPLRLDYRGVTVCELPPPTQGVAALEGLGLLALGEPTLADQVECMRLALDDARRHVRDGADVAGLLAPERLERRRLDPVSSIAEPAGGTVYVAAVDADGMAVSLIQSLYERFGSRVVAPGTGVVLQNRGACFSIGGAVEPGRRPYHTIIPAMLQRDGALLGPLGIVGGFVQAQAHLQVVSALVDDGLDPQAALDRPRFRVEGQRVLLEEGLWERAPDLEARGHETEARSETRALFGCGQAIVRQDDAWLGGSDARGDGQAAGY